MMWLYLVMLSTVCFGCCEDCCECAPDIITEENIQEAEKNNSKQSEVIPTKEGILRHLKLDNGQLDTIVSVVRATSNREDKINKIIEYSKDIDWDHPMCPNTLFRWEKNECCYIAYCHLMINNPYFLKFFLICDKTMRGEDTYVLNAICDAVVFAVNSPKFDKFKMGSVDPILKALFLKCSDDCNKYFYLSKESAGINIPSLSYFYFNHHYGEFLPIGVHAYVDKCLYHDLKISNLYRFSQNTSNILPTKSKPLDLENISALFNYTYDQKNNDLVSNQIKKIFGAYIHQYMYHSYALVYCNGAWYNKNTLDLNECCKMSIRDVLKLFNRMLKIKNPQFEQLSSSESSFW